MHALPESYVTSAGAVGTAFGVTPGIGTEVGTTTSGVVVGATTTSGVADGVGEAEGASLGHTPPTAAMSAPVAVAQMTGVDADA